PAARSLDIRLVELLAGQLLDDDLAAFVAFLLGTQRVGVDPLGCLELRRLELRRLELGCLCGPAPAAAAAGPAALAHRALGVRQEGELARRLDGDGHVALVLGTVATDAPGPDLAPVGH